jgi:hypothetical protein
MVLAELASRTEDVADNGEVEDSPIIRIPSRPPRKMSEGIMIPPIRTVDVLIRP